MAIYIQLLTLTPEGRTKMLEDPEMLPRALEETALPGVQVLGQYGVLGDIDFVGIVQAPDNDTVARFSLELGVRAGVHVNTMPAIPIGRLEAAIRQPGTPQVELGRELVPPRAGQEPAQRRGMPGV